MTIDDKMIAYLEDLSRLRLTEEQQQDAKNQLGKILAYMETLEGLDTDGVEPMSHPFPVANRFREDEVIPSSVREEILAGAPKQKDGCFQVPQTVE